MSISAAWQLRGGWLSFDTQIRDLFLLVLLSVVLLSLEILSRTSKYILDCNPWIYLPYLPASDQAFRIKTDATSTGSTVTNVTYSVRVYLLYEMFEILTYYTGKHCYWLAPIWYPHWPSKSLAYHVSPSRISCSILELPINPWYPRNRSRDFGQIKIITTEFGTLADSIPISHRISTLLLQCRPSQSTAAPIKWPSTAARVPAQVRTRTRQA